MTKLPRGARRLRCTVGTSDKFYDIILEGSSFTVNYGKWGTMGAFLSKDFDSPWQARDAYQKQIRSKLRKGYVDVTDEYDLATESARFLQTASGGNNVRQAMNQAAGKSLQPATASAGKKITPESVGRRRRKLLD